jgi:uncharacterized protein YfiM (DUF2279 family)
MKLITQTNFKICVLFVMGIVGFANAQIQEDKKLHFGAGIFTSAAGYTLVWEKTKNKKKALIAGIGTAILAGTVKELADSTKPGNKFDFEDLAATTLGGISFSVTINLFNKKKKRYVEIN